jgi:hypothetical protein
MSNTLLLENMEFYVDGVRFRALTAVKPEESDDTSSILTSDDPVQVGTPKNASEVTVEGVDMPQNIEEDLAQKAIFDKRTFNEATCSGIKNYADGSKARQTWSMDGGVITRNKDWNPSDQTTYSMTLKTKVTERVEPV